MYQKPASDPLSSDLTTQPIDTGNNRAAWQGPYLKNVNTWSKKVHTNGPTHKNHNTTLGEELILSILTLKEKKPRDYKLTTQTTKLN